MNTIAAVTKDCPREDCSIQDFGPHTSTCVGWSPTYDKHGNRTDRGDPNTSVSALRCSTCGASWHFSTQYGETTIRKMDPPAAVVEGKEPS